MTASRIQPSAAKTTTGTGAQIFLEHHGREVIFFLDLTAAATDVIDTLDVYVQANVDGTWIDVVHFTQCLGNGGAKQFVAKTCRGLADSEFSLATALGAAAVRHILSDQYRVRWAIVDADANASFTFSVSAIPRS